VPWVPWKPRSTLTLTLTLTLTSACSPKAVDRDELCADIGSIRACWTGAAARIVQRSVPKDTAPSAMGWRCVGAGGARRCAARAATSPAFVCSGSMCEQRHPRMPDDGEWRCSDSGGATICAGGEPAAGVAPTTAGGAPEASELGSTSSIAGGLEPGQGSRSKDGWFCGQRRGTTPPERVCVDFSPDFPDGNMDGWRCRTLYDGPVRRVCERDAPGRTLTAACDAGRPCVDGSRCVDGRCIPDRPAPSCVLQADCASGRCRFGSCLTEGT
jgi:hypothetical protein